MATNNKSAVKEAAKAGKPTEKVESVYTAAELASAHKTFGTSYAIVATALQLAGKERATVTEAKKIIEEFKNREVK